MIKSYYQRVISFPKTVLTSLCLLTLWLATYLPLLNIDASSDSLVLEQDQSLKTYRAMSAQFEESDFVILTYSPDIDLFAQPTRERIQQLKNELSKIKGVESVTTYLDVPLLYSPKIDLADFKTGIRYLNESDINLDMARQEFLSSPIYKQLITSQDEKTTAIVITFEPATELLRIREARDQIDKQQYPIKWQQLDLQVKKLQKQQQQIDKVKIEQIRLIIQPFQQHAALFLGGVTMIVVDMLSYLQSDMVVFGSAILLFIICFLMIIFRQLRWVLLPLLTCAQTCLIMLGAIALSETSLTVLSANFIAILLIVTLSVTVHLLVRFNEEEKKQPQLTSKERVFLVTTIMTKPCLYTTLTTLVAFLSLIVSGIKPVIEFGWMMSLAAVLALMVAFLVIPCGVMLFNQPQKAHQDNFTNEVVEYLMQISTKHYPFFLLVCLTLFLVAVVGMLKLKVENRFIDNFSDQTEIFQGMLIIDQQLGGTLPLSILITPPKQEQITFGQNKQIDESDDFFSDDSFLSEDFADNSGTALPYWFTRTGLKDIEKIHNFLADQADSGKVLSLATLYQVIKDLSDGNVDDVQLALVQSNLDGMVADTLFKPYLAEDGTARINVRVKETAKGLNRNDYIQRIDDFLHQEMGLSKGNYQLTGMMILYNNMLQSLFSSQIQTLGAVFFVILLMFGVLFRSIYLAFIAIVPNLLAAFFVLGIMGWLSIPLDIMTITIAAITLGIGVDNTIHYLYRFRKELSLDQDYLAAINRCHHSTGLAMCYTSMTIIFGFSILALSHFNPSMYFGILTSIAMLSALLGALMLLPAMLLWLKPAKLVEL